MSRRKIREYIFRLLFRTEFHTGEELPLQEELFFDDLRDENPDFPEQNYISEKFRSIVDHIPQIDEKLNLQMRDWSMDRIGKAELSILRLAAYEILFDDAVPPGVAINEAVELAKKYAEAEAFGFVNAVLGGLYRRENGQETGEMKESEGDLEVKSPFTDAPADVSTVVHEAVGQDVYPESGGADQSSHKKGRDTKVFIVQNGTDKNKR